MYISKYKKCHNGKPSAYCFYVKTKMLVDFHICISVPLKPQSSYGKIEASHLPCLTSFGGFNLLALKLWQINSCQFPKYLQKRKQ